MASGMMCVRNVPSVRLSRSYPIGPKLSVPAPRWRCAAVTAVESRPAQSVSYISDGEVTCLADQIKEAEQHFATLFQSGRPMPAAKTVAKLRKEIADMKLALVQLLEASGSLPVTDNMSLDPNERARLVYLEVERSIQRHSTDSSFEMALLQAENERLQDELKLLNFRKDQLEELAIVKGLRTPPPEPEPSVLRAVDPLEAALQRAKAMSNKWDVMRG